jgi:HAE1 family hydrophobic/amphiphilic exporter-1
MSAICIRRPVMTILVMASFIIAGIFGYKQLPVAAVPRVDFPTIQVTAQLPGRQPETMAARSPRSSSASSRPSPA